MQITLVAYYGDKPALLRTLLETLQRALVDSLGDAFEPYAMAQIHATVIGMETRRSGSQVVNRNYLDYFAQPKVMDLTRALEMLSDPELLPFELSIAGYRRELSYPFSSRGQVPYERSFSLQAGRAVAMGWPFVGGACGPSLDRLRRRLNKANILHKYHATPDAVDNDLFFVLGTVRAERSCDQAMQRSQRAVRELMANYRPVVISLARQNLSVVVYQDERLPVHSSQSFAIDEAIQQRIDIA